MKLLGVVVGLIHSPWEELNTVSETATNEAQTLRDATHFGNMIRGLSRAAGCYYVTSPQQQMCIGLSGGQGTVFSDRLVVNSRINKLALATAV